MSNAKIKKTYPKPSVTFTKVPTLLLKYKLLNYQWA